MPPVFDDHLIAAHTNRAARIRGETPFFLYHHMARAVSDRLRDIRRDFADYVSVAPAGVVVEKNGHIFAPTHGVTDHRDGLWPFTEQTVDLALSVAHMHWMNDPVGSLVQFRRALRPDGVFLGAMVGGDTLQELRAALLHAESVVYGGVSPRVSPFIALNDFAALMQRAQFALPVVDTDRVTVTYASLPALVADIRTTGGMNAVLARRRGNVSRRFWAEAADYYRAHFSDTRGRLVATVDILYGIGWAPDASQPRAKKPGSATVRLADALKTVEIGTGEKAG